MSQHDPLEVFDKLIRMGHSAKYAAYVATIASNLLCRKCKKNPCKCRQKKRKN